MSEDRKKVFIVRHAKSDWSDSNLNDLNRPLNKRGNETAPLMADYLIKLFEFGNIIMISSHAKRAMSTAAYFAKRFSLQEDQIVKDESLYFGNHTSYLDVISGVDNKYDSLFLFGHNPIIENFVAEVNNPYNGLVPTCAVLFCTTDNWQIEDFKSLTLENKFFPKLIFE